MRSFIRHPTDIPIEVRFEDQACDREPLRNVSRGGVCFQYPKAIALGSIILVRIALTVPPFEACCRVSWCQADIGSWQVGVEFLDQEDLFRVRMVEQICHIEHYRRAMRDLHGRILSGHEAALEWIEKHAGAFPPADEIAKPPRDK